MEKMTFICTVSWEHSGVRSYSKDEKYELSAGQIDELVALDKKKSFGAMEYFQPANESARKYFAEISSKNPKKQKTPEGT